MLECAQNLACVGAEPLGLTNCLNFGNPEKPVPAWQLDRAVSGLADACEALGVPVVGGNVSLYNEGPDGPIYPTPVVGMVGELPDPARAARQRLRREGDAIALVGPFEPSLAGSRAGEAARRARRRACRSPTSPRSPPPARAVRDAVRAGALASAHDISDGGLACALAECAIGAGIGCRVDLAAPARARLLPRGGAVRRGRRRLRRQRRARARSRPLAATRRVLFLGEVGGGTIEIAAGDRSLSLALADAERAWRSLASSSSEQPPADSVSGILPMGFFFFAVGFLIFSRLYELVIPLVICLIFSRSEP